MFCSVQLTIFLMSIGKKAIFVDRDGSLIVYRPYLSNPAEVELLPGIRETMQQAVRDGYLLFLFSNQSGVGRGYFSMNDVELCNARMFELLGVIFTGVCIATERPDEPLLYRKPSPRFINEMIALHRLDPKQCWMVGDALSDVCAGLNAGIHAVLLHSMESRLELPPGAFIFRDLRDFYRSLASNS